MSPTSISTSVLSPVSLRASISSKPLAGVRRDRRPQRVPPPREEPPILSKVLGAETLSIETPDPMLQRR